MRNIVFRKIVFNVLKAMFAVAHVLLMTACGGKDNTDPDTSNSQTANSKEVSITLAKASENSSVASQEITLPTNVTTACDSKWMVRILGIHRHRQLLPTLMHGASCKTPSGTRKMFTSLTVKEGKKTSGLVIESELDESTGYLKPTGVARRFDECIEMNGIAASSDCSVVGALCRRDGSDSKDQPFTKDMVASIPNANKRFRDWITQAKRSNLNDEEWLYDWADGQISKKPEMYVANKAIGNWEFGKQDLVYSDAQNSYGLSLEASVGVHDGDSFLVVERDTFSINPKRGWLWACGAGHTMFNHAAFNPATGKYAAICTTDLGSTADKKGGYGGLWVKVEGNKSQGFLSIPKKKMDFAGGVTGMLPLDDGGFLAAFAGTEATSKNQSFKSDGPATKIGIARFDTVGKLVGPINWIVSDSDWFYSYPKLASLGNGKYLLGYAKMERLGNKSRRTYGDAIRLPESFHVVEINKDGKKLNTGQTVKYGWGEQDNMVSLGDGKVAWAYIPKAQYTPNSTDKDTNLPKCAVNELALNVYTSSK